MENTTDNYEIFLLELVKLSEVCCEAMSEMRMELYWQTIGPLLSLEEWKHACAQALRHETFHKVPMPAPLIDYGKALGHVYGVL